MNNTMNMLPSYNKMILFIKILKKEGDFLIPWNLYKRGLLKSGFSFLKAGGIFSLKNNILNASYSDIEFPVIDEKDRFFIEDIALHPFYGWTLRKCTDVEGVFEIENDGLKVKLLDVPGVRNFLGVYNDYSGLAILERIIIDIGAFEGDSALFFAKKGAARVLAFEPNHYFIEKAKKLSQLNNVDNIIDFFSVGFGTKFYKYEGKESFLDTEKWDLLRIASIIQEKESLAGKKISLKVDCEGCEYDLFSDEEGLNALVNLGLDSIILEYHDKHSRELGKNRHSNELDQKCLTKLLSTIEKFGFEIKSNRIAGPTFGIAHFFKKSQSTL